MLKFKYRLRLLHAMHLNIYVRGALLKSFFALTVELTRNEFKLTSTDCILLMNNKEEAYRLQYEKV